MAVKYSLPLLITYICSAIPIQAASISSQTSSDGTFTIISLSGPIERGDFERFTYAAGRSTAGIVVLSCPGGDAFEGVDIGNELRARNMRTFVPEGKRCESACGLIWLAGTTRFAGKDSFLGFHAAWVREQTTAKVDGASNAVIGGYMNSLGLNAEAIYFLTEAGPESLRKLTQADAERLSIAAHFNSIPYDINVLEPKVEPHKGPIAGIARSLILPETSDKVTLLTDGTIDWWGQSTDQTLQYGDYGPSINRDGKSEFGHEANTVANPGASTEKIDCKQFYSRIIGEDEVGSDKTHAHCVNGSNKQTVDTMKVDFVNP